VSLSTRKILRRLYPGWDRPVLPPQPSLLLRAALRSRGIALRTLKWAAPWTGVLLVLAWFVGLFSYYNVFVAMTTQIEEDWANIGIVTQERHHVVANLTQMAVGFSNQVRAVQFTIAKERTEATPRTDAEPKPNEAALTGVAEQYPPLRLTENYQQLSTSVVETEHQVAEKLTRYNNDVNDYMTACTQWPGNMFAYFLGFESKAFVVIVPERLKFKEVGR
jgi:LemA protein